MNFRKQYSLINIFPFLLIILLAGVMFGILLDFYQSKVTADSVEQRIKEVIGKSSESVFSVMALKKIPHPGADIEQESVGSAVAFLNMNDETYIITNFHVVENADRVSVLNAKGQRFSAEIVGSDPLKDISVLKFAPLNRIPIPNFSSKNVGSGTFVVAIGSPYSFDNSASFGIISATGRTLRTRFGYEISNVIQTDAAINQGNSGGPLLDLNGTVVGINTAVFSIGGSFEGIGFAIPANEAIRIAKKIIKDGEPARKLFGITCADFDLSVAKSFNLPVDGVLVLCLSPQSPLAKAGVRQTKGTPGNEGFVLGDIITEINGERVKSIRDLSLALERLKGKKTRLIVYREGKFYSVDIDL